MTPFFTEPRQAESVLADLYTRMLPAVTSAENVSVITSFCTVGSAVVSGSATVRWFLFM